MKRESEKPRHSHREPQETRPKILLIDSDPVMSGMLRNYLGGEKGFKMFVAGNGAEGLRMAVEHVPDLILLDFRLDDMSGLDVHDRLSQNPATARIPVVYASPFLTFRTIERASSKGAKGFIRKPFTPSEIYTKLTTVLSSS